MAVLASVAMGTSHDKEANKAKMKGFVEQAAAQNGDLIVFPEYVLAGLPETLMTGTSCTTSWSWSAPTAMWASTARCTCR